MALSSRSARQGVALGFAVFALNAAACDGGSDTGPGGSAGSAGSGGSGATAGSGGSGATGGTGGSGATGGTGGSGATGGMGGGVPTSNAVFVPAGIAEIRLTLGQLAIDSLNSAPSDYVHGDIQVTLADGQPISLPNSGIRLKGKYGSFRTLDQKAAFLLKFDAYENKQELLGIEKLALNNMVQDPSMIHEQIAFDLFRAAGAPAPRSSYARVFVNNELYGLYSTVEVIDNSEFLNNWFGDDNGNLYEGEYGSDLEDGLLVTFDQDNGTDVGFSDLEQLKNALDSMTDPAQFWTEANAVIDMDRYVNFAANEIFIGHWDGYAWTRNNYFIYRGPDQRWTFLPWGTDQTFADALPIWGGDGRIEQMCGASLPCRQKLKTAFEDAAARVDSLGLIAKCDNLWALIEDAVQEDPRKEYDPFTVYNAIQDTKAFLSYRPGDVAGQLPCADPSILDSDNDGASGCGADCDDNNPNVYPGAPEICNLADDNCDGEMDEDPMCPGCFTSPSASGGTLAFCFKLKNWSDAEADCVAQGGHLASIHDQTSYDEVVNGAYAITGGEWYIGLGDAQTEGQFVWTDGTPFDFTSWNDGEPNNAGDEDCVHLASWAGGLWNDIPCDVPAHYVCRLP
ncbi:MAG: CotH kinase family protein [Polyangiaceae bacterium]|nr:CotH kinase family protein [Polyangiaceae bacterium]